MIMQPTIWFSQQEVDDNGIIQKYHMNSIVEEVLEAQYTHPHSTTNLDNTNNDLSYDDLIEMKPSKILKTTYILPKNLTCPPSSPLPLNSKPYVHHQSSSRILSFENAGSNVMEHENLTSEPISRKGTKRSQPFRSQSTAQDHIIAERKRREKLTQRFVSLSALVPGLTKMDKASVLGGAIKHMKYLQERVAEFEEQKKERKVESIVLVKKSKLTSDDTNESFSSSCEDGDGSSGLYLPEIEVKFSNKDILIRILCDKQNAQVAKIMTEIEKFPFSITNSIVMPFGPTLEITITAKKDFDFDMTLMDIVKGLRSILSKLIM